jgi:uncharacterized membrane protein YeaQ/YmgE (transglycosylase-associated protein family)
MHIFITILIGLAVGIVAKLLMPGRDPGGFIITTLLGLAGAFVARSSASASDGTLQVIQPVSLPPSLAR